MKKEDICQTYSIFPTFPTLSFVILKNPYKLKWPQYIARWYRVIGI